MRRCYRPPMPPSARSPLEGVRLLVVDGTNLLYRLRRDGAAPPAALVGRIRAAVPPEIRIELVFDGMVAGPQGRLATGLHVRSAGRLSGDDVILEVADAAFEGAAQRPGTPPPVLVVTDDRELRHRLLARGIGTAGAAWLLGRMGVTAGTPAPRPAGEARPPSIGAGRPPAAPRTGPGAPDDERPGWRPGRGATAKTGTARKVPRHRRRPPLG